MSKVDKEGHLGLFLLIWEFIHLVEAVVEANGCRLIDELICIVFLFAVSSDLKRVE